MGGGGQEQRGRVPVVVGGVEAGQRVLGEVGVLMGRGPRGQAGDDGWALVDGRVPGPGGRLLRLTLERLQGIADRRRGPTGVDGDRALGRAELKRFSAWDDGRPETELNFKFYRQATNKIVGISDRAAAFLDRFFYGQR